MNLLNEIVQAKNQLKGVVIETPLVENSNLSEEFSATILLKREDLQVVRSYKIRGAYNKMSSLSVEEKSRGVVCASAGNHAQGVALSCKILQIHGKIYMPKTTPKQKVKQVQLFGKSFVEIVLTGDAFDDAYASAVADCTLNNKVFIHPFNDFKVIAGQGTIGLEILEAATTPIDYIFVPIGGGGLAAGLSTVFKAYSTNWCRATWCAIHANSHPKQCNHTTSNHRQVCGRRRSQASGRKHICHLQRKPHRHRFGARRQSLHHYPQVIQ